MKSMLICTHPTEHIQYTLDLAGNVLVEEDQRPAVLLPYGFDVHGLGWNKARKLAMLTLEHDLWPINLATWQPNRVHAEDLTAWCLEYLRTHKPDVLMPEHRSADPT